MSAVNNIGTNVAKPTVEFTPEEYDQVLDTNLKSCYRLTQARLFSDQRSARWLSPVC